MVGLPGRRGGDGRHHGQRLSDVYAVFYVETDPVYASPRSRSRHPSLEPLSGRCDLDIEPGDYHGATATATVDNDGNAVFAFSGSSCAAGTSTVTADLLSGAHSTYTTTYTILPPQVTPS